jgi:D-alanyl-D-alanine carboxypeptidase
MNSYALRPRLFAQRALVSLVVAACSVAPAQAEDSKADLVRYADQLFSRAFPAGEPGAAVLIAKDGQVLLRKAYGLANLELGVPMQPDMVFEIASVTKQFTAAAILLLQERGKLSVNDEVTKYLPDYPTHGQKITIDHLLSHRSGIPELTGMPEWWPRRREDMKVQQIIDMFKDKPLEFTPGEKLSYSNSGYILLGAIIEKASGKSYEDFIEQEIFAPLGMKRSCYGHLNEVVQGRVTGYDKEEDGYKVAEYLSLTQAYAAGALMSTVDDLSLWADALSSEKLLKKASLDRMTTTAKLPSGQATKAGYGLQVSDEEGIRIVEHGGGLPGFKSYLLTIPGQRLAVIVLSNTFGQEPSLESLTYRIAMKVLGKPVEERKALNLAPATLDDYTGTYRFDEKVSRTVSREGNKLFARRTDGDKHEILATSRDDFFYQGLVSNSRIHFRRNAEGKITGMDFLYRFGAADETAVKTAEPLAGSAPPTPSIEPAAIQKTPAGRAFAAWLSSFNSGDPAQFRAFDDAYPREAPPLEARLAFREMTGGFTLLRIEKGEPTSLVVLLQEKASDEVARLELAVSSEEPVKILSSQISPARRPSDLAIPRMTETAALAALEERAGNNAKNDQFSGVVLVARHGKVLLQSAWGHANREAGSPNTLDTQFRIGSMNKMFTAVATLQLVEAGKLALDDPIGKYLPDYPNQELASKVTVRHLLTHTGGTGDIFGPEFMKNRLTLRRTSDYVKLFGSRPLTHEPGAEFRYSNYGFVLLGAVIERVSGLSYYDYVKREIFQPAGMTSTDSLPEAENVPNRAVGYLRREGSWVPNTDTLPWRGTSAGGGYSTASDLLRFAQALESGKLLSKAMFAEATSLHQEQYGYGFEVQGEGPLRSYGHNGGAPGINGGLRVFPQLGYVLVSLGNLDPPSASRLVDFFAARVPAAQ